MNKDNSIRNNKKSVSVHLMLKDTEESRLNTFPKGLIITLCQIINTPK